jgi:hypothetical protein
MNVQGVPERLRFGRMTQDSLQYTALDCLLDELDLNVQQVEAEWSSRRRHPRYPFRVDCVLHYLVTEEKEVVCVSGRTRNLSRGGLAFLARRMFNRDEAVEVEVTPHGRQRTFMAGLVRFCRYAGQGYYEVGIELKAVGAGSVLAGNPAQAMSLASEWRRDRQEHASSAGEKS